MQKSDGEKMITNLMKGIEELSTNIDTPNGTEDIKIETSHVGE